MNISEVAAKTGLTPVTLRYYEKIGLIQSVKRKSGGVRNYSEADLEWINFIKCMRSAGLSIDSLIHYTALYNQGSATEAERRNILIAERAQLEKKYHVIGETLANLNRKIAMYDR